MGGRKMKHTTVKQVTFDFMDNAKIDDVDKYIKKQIAHELIDHLPLGELEKSIKFRVVDTRYSNFADILWEYGRDSWQYQEACMLDSNKMALYEGEINLK